MPVAEIVTQLQTPIRADMFVRTLRSENSNYVGPTNRFGWLPVPVLIGPYWDGVPIEKYLLSQRDPGDKSPFRPSHEFARNVPPLHQEPLESFATSHIDWGSGLIVAAGVVPNPN